MCRLVLCYRFDQLLRRFNSLGDINGHTLFTLLPLAPGTRQGLALQSPKGFADLI